MISRGRESVTPHTGTETRTRLLREAAVRNIGQCPERVNQPSRVKDEGALPCKLLLYGAKKGDLSSTDGTIRISTG